MGASIYTIEKRNPRKPILGIWSIKLIEPNRYTVNTPPQVGTLLAMKSSANIMGQPALTLDVCSCLRNEDFH